jgi:hypothetical protein
VLSEKKEGRVEKEEKITELKRNRPSVYPEVRVVSFFLR